MSQEIDELKKAADSQEQYTSRNCLLVHGIEEKNNENTDDTVITFIKDNLGTDINLDDLDGSHRLGKPKQEAKKHRPIIVKFSRYNVRSKVFDNKKNLKERIWA